jgi:Flp pilus assembly protein TadB
MFEDLKKNIEHEKSIIADMRSIMVSMQADSSNRQFYITSLQSLLQQLYLLNKSVPDLLKEWSPVLKTGPDNPENDTKPKDKKTVKMSYVSPTTKEKRFVTINKEDKREFLEKLQLSENTFTKLKKDKNSIEKKDIVDVRKPNAYAVVSNRYFRKYADQMVPYFDSLGQDMKKGNVPFLLATYLAMAMFSAVVAFLSGLVFFIALFAINFSNWTFFWIPFGLTGLVLAGFYLYPASEASSADKSISYELPFATIHMAAIAGSDIEPTKLFKIIASSKEYPSVGKEVQKVIIQTEIYGYDLVASLKNVASRTPNKRLAELFSGLATNISTGGYLKNFLEKKAENFLLDYRLERQKYSDLAGTFMDVYISILIAAPLVLMMMFIVMNVAGLSLGGLGITALLGISVIGIVVVNIIFLVVLNIKQPKV